MPDPRIAAAVQDALEHSHRIVNVGAGAGSYEPRDRFVVGVEPSREMLGQRAAGEGHPVRGHADRLPLRDGAAGAALAVLTIHHWDDWRTGLREMRRVARERVVLLTWDPGHAGFWLVRDYFPEIVEIDRKIFPSLSEIGSVLGGLEVRSLPIPADCTDGFLGAYWRRPERYLDPGVRAAISTFTKLADPRPGLARLEADLDSGRWHEAQGHLLELPELDIGYRIVVARK